MIAARRALALAALGALLSTSCGPGKAAKTPSGLPAHEGPQHWFPLDAGLQWVYMVADPALDQRMMAIAKVVSNANGVAVVKTGAETTTYRLAPDGIVRDPAGGYLLKTPPKLGDKWPAAEGANVEVVKVDAAITVEAGSFEGCATTRERFPDGSTIERTFCPEVGLVSIDAQGLGEQGTMVVTSAKLRSFGMPESIAPASKP